MTRSTKISALRLCCLFTAVFSLAAHGYRYLSLGFTGDALQISQQGEAVYQATLGRFLQPVYWLVRGHITAPLTIGLFATAFLALSAYLMVRLFDVSKPLHIALLCGALATCETLALSNASYLPWVDVYMLALLFAVLGVYAQFRLRHGVLLAPLCYVASLALYQSYLPVAPTLALLLLIIDTLGGARIRDVFVRGMTACATLIAGLLLYALALKIVLAALGVQASQDYNGVSQVGLIALETLPQLLADTYVAPLRTLFTETPFFAWHDSAVPAALNLFIAGVALAMILCAARGLSLGGYAMLAFLIGMLPLSMNFIQFIAKGIASGLTIFAFHLLYLLPIALLARFDFARMALVRRAAAISLCVLIMQGVISTNQLYTKRELEFSSTLSAMTRLLNRMEKTQGYVPGETPVVITGLLSSSAIATERPGFEQIAKVQGMRYVYGTSHESAMTWYLETMLGADVNLVTGEAWRSLAQSEAASHLAVFPAADCCQVIDGTLYLRLN